jgi:hypothetical protein
VEAVTSRQHPFLRHRRSTSLERLHPVPTACRALPSSGDYCQILSVKELFLLVNRRGRREWRLFPPPTDPKIIEIWLNLRFISSEVRLLVGKNPGVDLIALLATNRGAPEQRKLALWVTECGPICIAQ